VTSSNIQLRNPATIPAFSGHPRVVGIEITGRCQLRCRHCFNHSGPDNHQELSVDLIEGILDEMISWDVRLLRLSGGEPTYHRRFRDVVAACERRGIRIVMNTHGIYRAELLEYLKVAPIYQFIISVDGLEANHNAIRGHGTFLRAIASCAELKQAGCRVMIACHVGVGNAQDVRGLVQLAAELGVDIKFSPIRPVGRAIDELPAALVRPDVYLGVVREVTELRRRFHNINLFTDFDILEGSPATACQRDGSKVSCAAGRTMVNINYDGAIYPCAFFVTSDGIFSAGNVHIESVSEVWIRSSIFTPFRVHQKSATCRSCSHYGRTCAGGCPAIAQFTSGSLDAHDPTCFVDLISPPMRETP
jgi:radical SAM protein with 4Fe4S-binding SPASM domain